jgi:hypothetical protein
MSVAQVSTMKPIVATFVAYCSHVCPISSAPPYNQATLWPTPCLDYLTHEAMLLAITLFCLQDIVSLWAFSGSMLAMHVATTKETFPRAPWDASIATPQETLGQMEL